MSKGILLVNLSSSDSFEAKDTKRYLKEFLMDERVTDYPYWLRYLIIRSIILNVRSPKASGAYKRIQWEEGSPLIVISKRLTAKVRVQVSVSVVVAMCYGNPNIDEGLAALHQQGVTEVLLIPLYPQYTMATNGTIRVLAEKLTHEHYLQIVLHKLAPFFHRKGYIEVLAGVTHPILANYPCGHLLFFYHGVPKWHLYKTSPIPAHKHIVDDKNCCDAYSEERARCCRSHCFETIRLLAEALRSPENKYSVSLQSRLGADRWLTPFTSDRIKALVQSGVKYLAVITPAFVADYVETLEKIEMVGGKAFVENEGESFRLIPCLDDSELQAKALARWINND